MASAKISTPSPHPPPRPAHPSRLIGRSTCEFSALRFHHRGKQSCLPPNPDKIKRQPCPFVTRACGRTPLSQLRVEVLGSRQSHQGPAVLAPWMHSKDKRMTKSHSQSQRKNVLQHLRFRSGYCQAGPRRGPLQKLGAKLSDRAPAWSEDPTSAA